MPPDQREAQADGDRTRTRLANERTQLAWWRTGLAAIAVALGAGRLLPELANTNDRWPYSLVGIGFGLYGIALIAFGSRRAREVERATGGPRAAQPTDAVLGWLTVAAIVLGCGAVALIVTQ